MDLAKLSLPKKIILGASILAVISLFFAWIDIGFASASGFQQQGYIFLIFFIYPVYCIIKNIHINKIGGLLSAGLAILAILAFMKSKSGDFFGETINVAGTGMYVFLIASVLLAVGVFLDTKKQQHSFE
ncbi:hypothetical protein [Solibacillus sp. CAU 1738]|uniref:hypothetical protein n=1 Tax=Solibacillus sp. CAU 1738 TaxID=3140363 RepID=UPI003261B1E5